MNRLGLVTVALGLAALATTSSKAADVLVQKTDIKSGVGYTVIADEQALTVAFDFSGPIRLMQMAHNGFEVYVNPAGKKKTTEGLIVRPLRPEAKQGPNGPGSKKPEGAPEMNPGERPEGMPERPEGAPEGMPERQPGDSVPPAGFMAPPAGFEGAPGGQPGGPQGGPRKHGSLGFEEAVWFIGADSTTVALDGSQGFKAYLDQTDGKNRCVVVIPIESIQLGKKKIEKVMLGLKSEPQAAPAGPDGKKGGQRQGTPPSGGRGGMGGPGGGGGMGGPGGGMGGPGGGGGMGGPGGGMGGPGGGMPGGQMGGFGASSTASNTIEVWFKCK